MIDLKSYYIISIALTIVSTIGGAIPLTMIINSWFSENRSTYIGIAFTGSGFGE